MLNSGVTSDTTGKAAIASEIPRMNFLPGKSSRAIAYAASVANTMLISVAIVTIPIEFRSAEVNNVVSNTVS